MRQNLPSACLLPRWPHFPVLGQNQEPWTRPPLWAQGSISVRLIPLESGVGGYWTRLSLRAVRGPFQGLASRDCRARPVGKACGQGLWQLSPCGSPESAAPASWIGGGPDTMRATCQSICSSSVPCRVCEKAGIAPSGSARLDSRRTL